MIFQCEDLRDFGLILVPPSSPEYEPLLADIQQRIDHPSREAAEMTEFVRRMKVGTISPEYRETSAILLNQSDKSIAMMQLIWRYEEVSGRTYDRANTLVFGKRVLLPFGVLPRGYDKIQAYWNTIFPRSSRYLGEDGMAGDNTDVRLPTPDEIWKGGGMGGRGGGLRQPQNPIRSVTLSLDGVFFTDGEFVGPDQFGLWHSVITEAKTQMDVARTARNGKAHGTPASQILADIEKTVGPIVDEMPAVGLGAISRHMEQQSRARALQRQRQRLGDEPTIDMWAALADTKLPDFRKR